MTEKTKAPEKTSSLIEKVKTLADTDRKELLEKAKAAGPPTVQKVVVNGEVKEIKVYSLRTILESETE